MRKFLRLALILACVSGSTAALTAVTVVNAQKRDETPQLPLPLPETPRAIAKLCPGGGVVHWSEATVREQTMRAHGCDRIEFVPLDHEYVLAYGVRVIVGE